MMRFVVTTCRSTCSDNLFSLIHLTEVCLKMSAKLKIGTTYRIFILKISIKCCQKDIEKNILII